MIVINIECRFKAAGTSGGGFPKVSGKPTVKSVLQSSLILNACINGLWATCTHSLSETCYM